MPTNYFADPKPVSAWAARYDGLQGQAIGKGVCPKITMASGVLGQMHYCGKPLEPGTRWCWMHQR